MFIPKTILYDENVLNYERGRNIISYFKLNPNIEIIPAPSKAVKSLIKSDSSESTYKKGKQTLVLGIKAAGKFQTCKPSADYQLPLTSGCMGQCEYCYLHTQLGDKPYIKIFVNTNDILQQAEEYIKNNLHDVTVFEGASTSDPVCVEPYTGILAECINYFGQTQNGRFRFVTKYNDIDSLISLNHNGHTEIRFSLNTQKIINTFEHHTASLSKRIEAALKLIKAGYPVGFLIAPVFLYDSWHEDYKKLLEDLKEHLPSITDYPVNFEIISHRYTLRAKERILDIFPKTSLTMDDTDRQYKYGQFGYGKYVYKKDDFTRIKELFETEIIRLFGSSAIKYII